MMDNQWETLLLAMEAKGIRMTIQRRLIAKIFSFSTGFVLPRDVHDYISNYIPGVSQDTVYRNLRLLDEHGLIERFDFTGGVRFKLKCGPDHHHHHLICVVCDRTYPLDFCPVESGVKLPDDFQVLRHTFEIHGICEDCGTHRHGNAECP